MTIFISRWIIPAINQVWVFLSVYMGDLCNCVTHQPLQSHQVHWSQHENHTPISHNILLELGSSVERGNQALEASHLVYSVAHIQSDHPYRYTDICSSERIPLHFDRKCHLIGMRLLHELFGDTKTRASLYEHENMLCDGETAYTIFCYNHYFKACHCLHRLHRHSQKKKKKKKNPLFFQTANSVQTLFYWWFQT